MRKLFYFLTFLVALLFLNCKENIFFEGRYRFWVKNNSNSQISFMVGNSYPDTLIPGEDEKIKPVEPGSKTPYDSKKEWKEVFDELPADTLSIFIFNFDTIYNSGYEWEEIQEDYKILYRYDISYKDLKSYDYLFPYPPV